MAVMESKNRKSALESLETPPAKKEKRKPLPRVSASPGVIRSVDDAQPLGTAHASGWDWDFGTLGGGLRPVARALARGVVRIFATYASSTSHCEGYPCHSRSSLAGSGAVVAVVAHNDHPGEVDVYVATNNHVVPSKHSGLKLKRVEATAGVYAPKERDGQYPRCLKLSSHTKVSSWLGSASRAAELTRAADVAFLKCSFPEFMAAALLVPLTPAGGSGVGDELVGVGYPGSAVLGYAFDSMFKPYQRTAVHGAAVKASEPDAFAHTAPCKKGLSGMPMASAALPPGTFIGVHRGRQEVRNGAAGTSDQPTANAGISVTAPTFACGLLSYVGLPVVRASGSEYDRADVAEVVGRLDPFFTASSEILSASCGKQWRAWKRAVADVQVESRSEEQQARQ
ncbi:uncharacterized protein AMSG_04322 [Thecamonas trahens ATCC 50062]|uniref:Serine protease n=1 Tax=Thecamonas trahens ATCC 50062 TaxID=461836 RepID=A0A0L0D6V8_THETB|nr:hypothetical protein AMSG_04322 [Thecamonas trahens ATCC 50062]KNC48092.1 hypothetical protein AMSG_04322 [Thecamonas trahens ATCC 50062]|eukprot:XP_013759105.1 hypothetical protein AMSG_04322 [Thecamonas trahens ATCC 50062]